MTILRRSLATCALFLMTCAAPALATGSLSFAGGGYWIDMEVGQTTAPVIASVRVYRGADSKGIALPMRDVVVERFDPSQRMLELRFRGAGDRFAVGPFSLSASGDSAELRIGPERIVSKLDWGL